MLPARRDHPRPGADVTAASMARAITLARALRRQGEVLPQTAATRPPERMAWRPPPEVVTFWAHRLHDCGALITTMTAACWHCRQPISN